MAVSWVAGQGADKVITVSLPMEGPRFSTWITIVVLLLWVLEHCQFSPLLLDIRPRARHHRACPASCGNACSGGWRGWLQVVECHGWPAEWADGGNQATWAPVEGGV